MKTKLIELSETKETLPKYRANGKRITRDQFVEIKRNATRQDTFYNTSVNGAMVFYSTAHVPFDVLPDIN